MMSVLEVKNIKKHYVLKKVFGHRGVVKALDGVSFALGKKETLAVVGESGCGKTTLAKVLMQIEALTEGEVYLNKTSMRDIEKSEYYRKIQMIFQDPYSSINPRKRAWQIISEPLKVNQKLSDQECREQALALMSKVGLRPELADRYPHMFSGGQRQRIGIARALTLRPEIIICDEPVSALDISIQAQVINLLIDLQNEFELSYIFISHDLGVVKHLSDKVIVMYLGQVVEYGTKDQIFKMPLHPYTQVLLESVPGLKNKSRTKNLLEGELPSPLNPPSGCRFHKRCPMAKPECSRVEPVLELKGGRLVACHLVD